MAPVASSQQSASSRATEQLTATLHQLLQQQLHPPRPSAPPAAGADEVCVVWCGVYVGGRRPIAFPFMYIYTKIKQLRPAPSAPSPLPILVPGAAKPAGPDEETKQAEIPHAYAVTVYEEEEELGGGRGGGGGERPARGRRR